MFTEGIIGKIGGIVATIVWGFLVFSFLHPFNGGLWGLFWAVVVFVLPVGIMFNAISSTANAKPTDKKDGGDKPKS